jgi:hypothetical protein
MAQPSFLKNTLFAGNTTQKEINCPRVLCNIISFNGPSNLVQLLQIENFELMHNVNGKALHGWHSLTRETPDARTQG